MEIPNQLSLTKEQAIIITGFTGIMAVSDFDDFATDCNRRYGRPVFTHEYPYLMPEIKELYRDDFLKIVYR